MVRIATLIATATLALSGVAQAQSPEIRAIPVAVQTGKFIAGDSLWTCGDGGCTTAKVTARPAIACAQLVKEVGAVQSFAAAGKVMKAEDLAQCNTRAKGATALAGN